MCINKQSGECLSGGPAHNHNWKWIRFTGPKAILGDGVEGFVAQTVGQRDDDIFFQVPIKGGSIEEILKQEVLSKEILDYELKCCTCDGRDTHGTA